MDTPITRQLKPLHCKKSYFTLFPVPFPLLIALLFMVSSTVAQTIAPAEYQNLRYRLIGPFRASRTVGAVGIP